MADQKKGKREERRTACKHEWPWSERPEYMEADRGVLLIWTCRKCGETRQKLLPDKGTNR